MTVSKVTTNLALALNSLPLLLLAPFQLLLFLPLLPRELLLRDLVVEQLKFGDAAFLLNGGLKLAVQGFDGNGRQRLAGAFLLAQPQRDALQSLVNAYTQTYEYLQLKTR